tara:strand:+ start:1015 stop:2577 length:1563 start_codon:yes stop_codon:yes gene_type:complete
METRTLINIGHEETGTGCPIPLTLFEEGTDACWAFRRQAYQDFMAVFLKQDHNIEKAYIQVKDGNMSITLHGFGGNVFFVKFNEPPQTPRPITGDFLLEGTADHNHMHDWNMLCDAWNLQNNNPHNRYSATGRKSGFRIPISPARTMNYQRGESTNLSIVRTNFQLNMGLSGFSIPISWSPITGANGVFKSLSTVTESSSRNVGGTSNGDPERRYIEELRELSAEPSSDSGRVALQMLNLPLTPHVSWIHARSAGYRQSPLRADSINLVFARKSESIVRDALPNDYDTARLAFLCEMPQGTIRRGMTKIKKSKPFGSMTLHYDTDSEKILSRVTNGENEVQRTSIGNNIIYSTPNITGTSSITYPTWFDFIETNKRTTPSVKTLLQRLPREATVNELIGATTNGALVYGIKNRDFTIMTTLTTLGRTEEYSADVLSSVVANKKSVRQPAQANAKPVEKEIETPKEYETELFYIKWKEVSDEYRTQRGEIPVRNIQKVFLDYCLTSPSVTDEDKEEFKRLK